MRIIALSDTHCKHHELTWFFECFDFRPDDILIHAGDSADSVEQELNYEEQMDFIDWYSNIKCNHKIYVPGNHNVSDDPSMGNKLIPVDYYKEKGIIMLNNETATINGITIYGNAMSKGNPAKWAFSLKDNKDYWENNTPIKADIIVTHGMPFSIGDTAPYVSYTPNTYEFIGDRELRKVLQRRSFKLYIGGHCHDCAHDEFKNNGIYKYKGKVYANVSIVNNNTQVVNDPLIYEFPQ